MVAAMEITGALERDLRGCFEDRGTEAAIAAVAFIAMVRGNPRTRALLTYDEDAITVWRVLGDGQPPPELDFFVWGEHRAGVPSPLRIWYLRQGTTAPRGIGAFPIAAAANYPERAEVSSRIAHILSAPSCWLEDA